jgi:hypothetical protein
VAGQVAQLLGQKAGVVFAVSGRQLLVRKPPAERIGHRIGRKLLQLVAPFHPAGALEIRAGVFVKVVQVSLETAEEERHAIMAAWDHQGDSFGPKPHNAVAAKTIAQKHGVIPGGVHGGDGLGQAASHGLSTQVMQPFGQKLQIDLVDRSGHHGTGLPI